MARPNRQSPADVLMAALGLARPPDPELDPFLDATARCFLRYGVRRTSVPDVAEELGVSRSTVYRRAGSIEDLARKLLAREVAGFLRTIGPVEPRGPEAVIGLFASIVSFAAGHRVFRKLLKDEPELVGRFVVRYQQQMIAASVPFVAAVLRRSMREGRLARRDPESVAEGLLRLTVSLVLSPPRDARSVLTELLRPVLTPDGASR